MELDIWYHLVVKNMISFTATTRYLIGIKSGITYVISHNYAKIKIDSYNSFPLKIH